MSAPQLEVIWDAAKAQSNLAKHGVSFAQAATVLLDPLALTVFDAAHSEQEERWFTLGLSSDGKLLALAHTFQSTEAATPRVRIISARLATRREREQYENEPR
ncbi:MAG TPA: BrnT family toxin [Steroidobacteraceae bacterium]|nr:BrnT family toxin [Steroidobacteraceae bacterium]